MRLPSFSKTLGLSAAFALALLGTTTAAPAQADPGGSTTINLVGITDLHGHIARVTDSKTGAVKEPGAVTMACEIAKARAADPDTLLVSNGDNVGGSAYISSILKDQPTIDVLNALGLDVTSAGNHEFDQGIDDLGGRLVKELQAPILSANVTGNAGLDAEGDRGVFVKDVKGLKVGFIGVVTDELPSLVSKSALKGLRITGALEAANARATELKDGNPANGEADVVVVLAHEDADVIGPQFNGSVDAVVGGHTHVPYEATVTGKDGNQIAVIQPDHYGLKLGQVSLSYDPATRKVTPLVVKNLDLSTSTCNTDAYGVEALVSKAAKDSEAAGAQVLAQLGTDFLRGTNDGTDSGANRSTESTASNVIADSFQAWLAQDIKPAGKHHVGLMNPGGVRGDYLKGELTEGEAYTVQPFGNEMAYATITGAQLKQVLREQWQPTTSRAGLTLGVSSNVRVYANLDASEELNGYYQQISSGTKTAAELASAIDAARARVIEAVYVDGAPLADEASVVVASNTFLLAGGDNFNTLGTATMINTGILDRTVTAKYLKAVEPAQASLVKRQMAVDIDTDVQAGTTTLRLAGLSFTAASEQAQPGQVVQVLLTAKKADGSAVEVAQAPVDLSLTPGLPDTGRASITFSLPEGLTTESCTLTDVSTGKPVDTTCAQVAINLVDRGQQRTELDLYAQVQAQPASGSTTPGGSAAPGGSGQPQAGGQPGNKPQPPGVTLPTAVPTNGPVVQGPNGQPGKLARTGVSAGLGLACVGLLGVGALLLARRRARS